MHKQQLESMSNWTLVYVSEKEMKKFTTTTPKFLGLTKSYDMDKEREIYLGRAERVAEVLDRDSEMEDKKTVPGTELWRIQNI